MGIARRGAMDFGLPLQRGRRPELADRLAVHWVGTTSWVEAAYWRVSPLQRFGDVVCRSGGCTVAVRHSFPGQRCVAQCAAGARLCRAGSELDQELADWRKAEHAIHLGRV